MASRTLRPFRTPPVPFAYPRSALVLAGAIFALAFGAGPAPAAEEINLLANPSAEEGTLVSPSAWDTSQAGLPTVRFEWSTETAREGTHSLYVVNTSDVVPMWHNWSQTLAGINHWAGKELVFRGWLKTRSLTGKAYALLQAYRDTVMIESMKSGVPRLDKRWQMGIKPANDPQLEMGWARKYISGDHADWVPFETRLVIPPSTNLVLVRVGVLGVGEAWFDDLSLVAQSAPPQRPFPLAKNLLVDPGFEGNLDDWDFSMPPVEGLRIRLDATAHSGLQSCLIECQNRPPFQLWSHVFQVFNTRALSGKRVRMSGWFKLENLKNTFAALSVTSTGFYGSYRPMVSKSYSGTHDWAYDSVEVDIPRDTYTVWVRAVLNTGVGKVWFDDLKFEVLGDSPKETVGSAVKASESSKGSR